MNHSQEQLLLKSAVKNDFNKAKTKGVSADLHHLISIIGKKNKILQRINMWIILASLQLCYI